MRMIGAVGSNTARRKWLDPWRREASGARAALEHRRERPRPVEGL